MYHNGLMSSAIRITSSKKNKIERTKNQLILSFVFLFYLDKEYKCNILHTVISVLLKL